MSESLGSFEDRHLLVSAELSLDDEGYFASSLVVSVKGVEIDAENLPVKVREGVALGDIQAVIQELANELKTEFMQLDIKKATKKKKPKRKKATNRKPTKKASALTKAKVQESTKATEEPVDEKLGEAKEAKTEKVEEEKPAEKKKAAVEKEEPQEKETDEKASEVKKGVEEEVETGMFDFMDLED